MQLYSVNESLNEKDKKFLRLELRQVIIAQLMILLLAGVLFSAGLVFLIKVDPFESNSFAAILVYSILSFIAYMAVVWKNLRSPILDLRKDYKIIFRGKVESKFNHSNYGWTGNPAVDSRNQPKLEEYYLVINKRKYFVDEKEYAGVEVDDEVYLSFAASTNKLIDVWKIQDV